MDAISVDATIAALEIARRLDHNSWSGISETSLRADPNATLLTWRHLEDIRRKEHLDLSHKASGWRRSLGLNAI